MWATYKDALREVGDRKVLIILCLLALAIGLLFNRQFRFEELNGVQVIVGGRQNMGPWTFAVPTVLAQLASMTGVAWVMFMVFVGCPMFVQSVEKGWRELTFSKGTPRWHILVGRYLASVTLFLVLVFISDFPMAARFWWVTGIPTWPIVVGMVIQAFSFASFLSLGAVVAMMSESVAVPLISAFALTIVGEILLNRRALYEEYITSPILQFVVDWIYYILPKNVELQFAATNYVATAGLPTAWPVWTTGLFILGSVTLASWLLERKSF